MEDGPVGVDSVQYECMEMHVEIGRRVKTLDARHGPAARILKPQLPGPPSLVAKHRSRSWLKRDSILCVSSHSELSMRAFHRLMLVLALAGCGGGDGVP